MSLRMRMKYDEDVSAKRFLHEIQAEMDYQKHSYDKFGQLGDFYLKWQKLPKIALGWAFAGAKGTRDMYSGSVSNVPGVRQPLKITTSQGEVQSSMMRSWLPGIGFSGVYILSHADEIGVNFFGRESTWDTEKARDLFEHEVD